MKKLRLIVVGKLKESYFVDACNEYMKRLTRFIQPEICELKDRADDVTRESDDILAALKGEVWLADIGGDLMTSEHFSEQLTGAFSHADVVSFVIGGSCGVDERVKARADRKISFGKMTYPHMLMRVIALEQLYRAFTIKERLPYHK